MYVCVYMCIYIYTCMYVCMYIYIYIYTYIQLITYTSCIGNVVMPTRPTVSSRTAFLRFASVFLTCDCSLMSLA